MFGPKILIVDDSPTALRMTREALIEKGFETAVAVDGEAALEVAMSEQPALVLLDIVLPKKNGFQVCRKLKTDAGTRDMKVILLSSKKEDTDREWGLRQGADAYLTKPYELDELVSHIEQILATKPAIAAK
jgi:twitching motility two-component system response regulator PilH